MAVCASMARPLKVGTTPAFPAGPRGVVLLPYPRGPGGRFHYVSLGTFVVVLALGAAALAIWAVVRFPKMGPETLVGALAQVAIAFLAGLILVPIGMQSALGWDSTIGPLAAVFVFALPGLLYLFLASLWAMRVLQQMLNRTRRF
jgi:hypothetical protein